MPTFATLLHLIRFKNLLLLAVTQTIVYLSFMNPFHMVESHYLYLDVLSFLLLVVSTASITAGGYIINDYFDIHIDAINRPSAALVTHKVSKKSALLLHGITTLLGVLLGFIVAYRIGHIYYGWIQVVTAILLWFYSTHFKKQAHIGNLLVSILTAGSILIVWIFNPVLHRFISSEVMLITRFVNPFYLVMGIVIFALLINWMREIVKDIEDYEGDEAMGCRTLPILHGIAYAKRYAIIIGIVIVLLFLFLIFYFMTVQLAWYKIVSIIVPALSMVYIIVKLREAKQFADFGRISRWLKWTMVQCLFLILIYAHL